ncbi:SWIM zinc finger family protein [Streptomyces tibetensis]|uniref:SWIM zinc finger family protein n=1 Tax=Streptomyces tibetensis TaxID=2382123 RepID=A0ABW6MMK5_9ACTN
MAAAGGRADRGVPGAAGGSGVAAGGRADGGVLGDAGGSGVAAAWRAGGGVPEVGRATERSGGQQGRSGPEAEDGGSEVGGAPRGGGAPRVGGAPENLPAAVTPDPQASGDSRTSPPEATSTGAASAQSSGREGTGRRAADVAREALRAARDDARRAREETEREGARRRRRARQSAVDDRAAAARRAAGDAPGRDARDVGQLLSGAFLMPDLRDTDSDDHEPTPGRADRPARDPSAPSSAPVAPAPPLAPPATSAARTPPPSGTPRSMAAPTRDNELRRTFPPLPPRDGDRFAESWWGNAWVEALEQGALDVKRLERGRGYAGQGHVDAITVTPGLVLAYVQGSRPRPYRVQVHLRTLDDTDWDRFLDAAADRPGHIAALLDKEMPQSLAECGVPLLPGPGDLEPRCSCPDRGHPCKHAAALCYQTARLLDADPFVLLLLRGRGERELLDALSRLSATRAARAAQDKGPAPLPGVRAAEVLASRALAPLPAPLPPLAHPEQPPAYPAAPGGPDPFALDQLATDAAARAHALLGTGRDPVGQLTFWQDAVRLAAARPGSGLTAGTRALYKSLASAAGRTTSELARAVAAWRQGGLEGLAVLEEPWDPPAGRFDRARPLLLAADLPAFRPWRNHLTHPRGHVQLRLGRDGLWYAYESEPGHDDWWPRGTPDLDPVGALTGLGVPGDL